MRALIVDDEPAARQRLARLLAEAGVEVVGEAADGVEALARVGELAPDLVLLDIAMPEVDGFDVARHLEEPRPLIVFQTAYDEYALEAFEHEALDYVVKPVTRERLARALERARRRLGAGGAAPLPADLLARLRQAIEGGGGRSGARLLVRDGRAHRLLPLAEVLLCTAEDGASYAHAAGRRYLTDYTLKELEARAGGRFLRVGRSALVNLDAVETVRAEGDGAATLTLAGGAEVRVSRRRAAAVRAALTGE